MPVEVTHRVNFYDTDAMAVVHHANYIRWFEIGRVAYLRRIGITLGALMEAGYVFPITKVGAEYHAPGHFDDELVIETTATALTKAKMVFSYRILNQAGTLLVSGFSENVFTHRDTGHITRLPKEFYVLMEAAMTAEKEGRDIGI
ncbi:thioesterase family protein [uncultured Selenomonas sp.]|uniref:acyl-CoA thioesterase n=1 Tax=uncultured Selenomonas sp. TaxID=159275 RepID=UPI0025E7EF00|nr:thioesterase family protein [uncultured Selenomonas sp.]